MGGDQSSGCEDGVVFPPFEGKGNIIQMGGSENDDGG